MHEWIQENFGPIFLIFFIALWTILPYPVALTGGWRLLAKRFSMQGPFVGQKWKMQSARMRWLTNYNNILTIGANHGGLFIVPMVLLRAWHPPLFIPWVEITAVSEKKLFFFKFVELHLGRSEEIPFAISAKLAAKIEVAAGPGWPVGYTRAAESQPPPIE